MKERIRSVTHGARCRRKPGALPFARLSARGFSLAEMLLVLFISLVVIALLTSTLIIGRNAWERSSDTIELQQTARFAMDRVIAELSQTQYTQVEIKSCGDCNPSSNVCGGDVIVFRTPQVTDDQKPGTIYHPDGYAFRVKWGADQQIDKDILYMAARGDFSPTHQGRLIRLVHTRPPPDTSACPLDNASNYTVTVIADEIRSITFEGFDASGNPELNNPRAARITLEVQKRNAQSATDKLFTVQSFVNFRN